MSLVLAVAGAGGAAADIGSGQLLSLEGQFFCVSCHEPLNQVYSPQAQDEKATLAQLLDGGLTLSQVKAQMVADYGEGVLAKPGDPWIYAVPIAAVVLAVGGLVWLLPRWRERRSREEALTASTEASPPRPSDAEEARLDRELEAF